MVAKRIKTRNYIRRTYPGINHESGCSLKYAGNHPAYQQNDAKQSGGLCLAGRLRLQNSSAEEGCGLVLLNHVNVTFLWLILEPVYQGTVPCSNMIHHKIWYLCNFVRPCGDNDLQSSIRHRSVLKNRMLWSLLDCDNTHL